MEESIPELISLKGGGDRAYVSIKKKKNPGRKQLVLDVQ